jgi:aspartate/methionine/tyrosine aminotransferase
MPDDTAIPARPPRLAARLRRDSLRRSPIRQIMELAARDNIVNLGLDPDEVISFAGGWVNHRAPEGLREEYRRIAADPELFHQTGGYSPTRGLPELRQALLAADRALFGTEGLTDAHVIVGQSSTQLTFCLFSALLDRGDRVLLFDPTYANYPPQLGICQEDIEVLTQPVLDTGTWSYFADVDAILAGIEETLRRQQPKLLLFSSPDNPSGQIVPDEAFFAILRMAAAAGCLVAVDYAYRTQYFSDRAPAQFGASPAEHENLIRIHSNSKWCRGLGRRLGWIEARPDIIEALEIVQQSVALCPDTVHQVALARYLEKALGDGSLPAYIDQTRRAYAQAAAHMGRCIEQYLGMPYLTPQGGLYTVVDVGGDGDRFVREVLEQTGVVFVPGRGFGATLGNAIRVSFGPLVGDLEQMEAGFARVRAYLDAKR